MGRVVSADENSVMRLRRQHVKERTVRAAPIQRCTRVVEEEAGAWQEGLLRVYEQAQQLQETLAWQRGGEAASSKAGSKDRQDSARCVGAGCVGAGTAIAST